MISILGVGNLSSVGHHAVFILCVSDAHKFTANPSSVFEDGYCAFGELARFTCCLLQNCKLAQSLPVVEKSEGFMLPNYSRFAPTEEKGYLEGSRTSSALEKVGSAYLRTGFRKDAPKFLEELKSTVLSTVAARSDVGQGLSCFCPKIVVGSMTMTIFTCSASS